METQKSALVLAIGLCLTVAVASALPTTARIIVQVVGVVLVLIGAVVLVGRAKKDKRGEDGLWLPSRDEDER